ncbi:hypothetical protein VPH35_138050 [Triticum aestivum]|uniref:Uncharacterized protein n=1 Tax=Aegilops tauschii TaxID=37682 RepID=M8BQZ1_AEGTA
MGAGGPAGGRMQCRSRAAAVEDEDDASGASLGDSIDASGSALGDGQHPQDSQNRAGAKGNEIHYFIAPMDANWKAAIRALLPLTGPGDRRGTRGSKPSVVPATRCPQLREDKEDSRKEKVKVHVGGTPEATIRDTNSVDNGHD